MGTAFRTKKRPTKKRSTKTCPTIAALAFVAAAGLTLCMPTGASAWEAEPAPPYPPRPSASSPPRRIPPPRDAYPPSPAVSPPPPLSPMTRALYAPFYVAGLVVRYGVYYAVMAPLEVFSRTVTYGERGGIERRPEPEPEER